MKREEEIALLLLGSALFGRPAGEALAEAQDAAMWEKVMDVGIKQTVYGHLFDAMVALPADLLPPREIRMKMLAYATRAEQDTARVKKVLGRIIGVYRAGDIDFVVLKGLAAAAAYPVPEHRVQGDIDLYIMNGRAGDAQQTLFGNRDMVRGEERHYTGMIGGVVVENHFGLMHSQLPLYESFEEELRGLLEASERIMIDLGSVEVPSPGAHFNVLFMLEHSAFHLLEGIGLRHLSDWAMQLWRYRDSIDKEYITAIIDRYGFRRIANAFIMLCVDKLGLPADAAPFEPDRGRHSMRDAAYVMELILRGGNFGYYYDTLHSSKRHLRYLWLPTVVRRGISAVVMLRNRRKFRLINSRLLGGTLRRNLRK